jgi:hypothetical protein
MVLLDMAGIFQGLLLPAIYSLCSHAIAYQELAKMSSKPRTILSDATNGFKNGLRRMTTTSADRPLANGKENYPSRPQGHSSPSTIQPLSADPHRWDPVNGMIIIKVSVPSTDDIWRFKVPDNISFRGFRAKVELKVGFAAVFMEKDVTGRRIVSEEAFRRWVAGRVRNGRNYPLVVHKRQHPFFLNPSTPTSPLSPTFPSPPLTPLSPITPLPSTQASPLRSHWSP